ncbi:MAG: hypothetical protein ACJ735_14115 [Actinomycetes bacterium]
MATGVTDRVTDVLSRAATWRPGGSREIPPEERMPVILLFIGALCMPLGIVAVLLGWWGAAHTPYGFEQTPYLISGIGLGVVLMLLGGFLFFGAWIARVALNTRRSADQMARLTEQLARGGAPGGTAVNGDEQALAPKGLGTSQRLVATATGSMLHRADCPIVATRDNLRDVKADEQGTMKPCQICQPLVADTVR